MAFYAFDFAKCYAKGKLEAILPLQSKLCSCKYHLVFNAIVNSLNDFDWGGHNIGRFDQWKPNSTLTRNRENDPVFRGSTKFVHGPQKIIPSLVRFERAKERLNLIGELLAGGTVYAAFDISFGFTKRKMNVVQVRRITEATNIDSGQIKGSAQILDCGYCVLCEDGRNIFSESEFVEFVNSVRLRLSDKSIWGTLEKSPCAPIELGNIFLSPINAGSGISKLVSHSNIEGMKANPKTSSEYVAFENLLQRIVRVPHSEIKAKLEAEKRAKKKRTKTSPASRASSEKD
jgi:hypothetical protein